jgi:signal transduction histidine kinase
LDTCDHIQQILDNSLDLRKLEAHKLVLENERVHIREVVDQVYRMLRKSTKVSVAAGGRPGLHTEPEYAALLLLRAPS